MPELYAGTHTVFNCPWMVFFFLEEAFETWIAEFCHHKRQIWIWILLSYNICLVKEKKVDSVLKFKVKFISLEHWIVHIVIWSTLSVWWCPRNLRRLHLDVSYLITQEASNLFTYYDRKSPQQLLRSNSLIVFLL